LDNTHDRDVDFDHAIRGVKVDIAFSGP